ncbi:trehalose-phosphatase [Croceicoccus ponticola]|uniref:trehalose-phosphatase n=1 Tax=Croceicoccus ponticola TaxID=2217664 RepID=UPI001F0B7311|nr:trehalose-phosphatase [Croceicoccus ponticola]
MTFTLPRPPAPDPLRDALFLDFDGTLVPLAERPEGVVVTSALIDRLHRLTDLFDGRLALVSGRAIAVLDEFGLSGLPMAGSHGAEWRLADGQHDALPRPAALDDAKTAFVAFADAREGVLFEDKPLGAALHFRLAPGAADDAIALATSHAGGLHLQHGHAMIEVRVPGVHKGTAIAAMMARTPFAGYNPLFLGDDVTDEDGFAAAARLGGHGVLVGPSRQSNATFALSDPVAVNAWLAELLEPAR